MGVVILCGGCDPKLGGDCDPRWRLCVSVTPPDLLLLGGGGQGPADTFQQLVSGGRGASWGTCPLLRADRGPDWVRPGVRS